MRAVYRLRQATEDTPVIEIRSILDDLAVRNAIQRAWLDSKPGIESAQENGGFIVRKGDSGLDVIRWPPGELDTIVVPVHSNCRIHDCEIVASFHTHPNMGETHLQPPSRTDRRAVQDDPDLKGADYVGELVIALQMVYLIRQDGAVDPLGSPRELIGIE